MQLRQENVKINKLVDYFSGQNLLDVNTTIINSLDKREIHIYSRAIGKVLNKETLNRDDLKVLDKIDELTYKKHDMCLKDSAVTKARIKACKKYGMQFIDRDSLAKHMNLMSDGLVCDEAESKKRENNEKLGYFLLDRLGVDRFKTFANAIAALTIYRALSRQDIEVLAEAESIVKKELNCSILSEPVMNAIDEACKRLKVSFTYFSKQTMH
ncbi:hypothetical protein POPA111323_09545 [Polynucleobacter paneuropaeus]|nr:hypothetical protein [Polynucleobacter paneuropaeus]